MALSAWLHVLRVQKHRNDGFVSPSGHVVRVIATSLDLGEGTSAQTPELGDIVAAFEFFMYRSFRFSCTISASLVHKMLQTTNRLDRYLDSKGHGVFDPDVDPDESMTVFSEAEFVESPFAGQCKDASTLAIPPGFDFSALNRLSNDESSGGYVLYSGRDDDFPSNLSDTGVMLSDDKTFDILWLSATEFLTLLEFSGGNWVRKLHSMKVEVGGVSLTVHAHRLMKCEYSEEWNLKLNPPPVRPLRFMAHLVAPIWEGISAITLDFATAPPEEATLDLIPTTDHALTRTVTVTLRGATTDLLRALASHPLHSQVLLRLRWGYQGGVSALEMNDCLKEFQKSVHLEVPEQLLEFNDYETSFAANPAFQSLTIVAPASTRLSPKMMDAMACNAGMKHLTIDCDDWQKTGTGMELIVTLLRKVALESASLESLTLVSHYDYFSSTYQPFKNVQGTFDGLAEHLDSNKIHVLSKFLLTFPYNQRKSLVKSNADWDSQFAPSLLLNCLRRQPGGRPSARVSGVAVQSINQGRLYSRATNIVPFDRSTSSASAIFDILRSAMSDKKSGEESVLITKSSSELKETLAKVLHQLDEFCVTGMQRPDIGTYDDCSLSGSHLTAV
jgi:hypothetical protein